MWFSWTGSQLWDILMWKTLSSGRSFDLVSIVRLSDNRSVSFCLHEWYTSIRYGLFIHFFRVFLYYVIIILYYYIDVNKGFNIGQVSKNNGITFSNRINCSGSFYYTGSAAEYVYGYQIGIVA